MIGKFLRIACWRQQVVHDDDGQEPERAEKQDHQVILREPSPAVSVISSGTVKLLADTLNLLRILVIVIAQSGHGDRRSQAQS